MASAETSTAPVVDESGSNGFHADAESSSPAEAAPPVAPPDDNDAPPQPAAPAVAPAVAKAVDDVLRSDIGISTLLSRLKQSIASAKELATFMTSLAKAEESKGRELKRLARLTLENIQRGDSRGGSWARQFEQVARLHEQMGTHGQQFVLNLNTMSQDLMNLAGEKDKERKHWKQIGTNAEDRAREAERQLDKAKMKYDSLAEDYDHVKTGDRAAGRHFGIRSMGKSSDQREEDLHRRVKNADEDYQSKVQNARELRRELEMKTRPEVTRALQLLIQEVDSATTMQLQKLAGIEEQNLVRNGLLINPMPDLQPGQKGFRQIAAEIDNEQDFRNYLVSFSGKIPQRPAEIKYQQHPTLKPAPQLPPQAQPRPQQPPQQAPSQPAGFSSQPPPQFPMQPPPQQQPVQQQPPALPPQNFQRFDGGFGQQAPSQFPQHPLQEHPYGDGKGYGGQETGFYPQQQPPSAPQYVPGPQGGAVGPPRPPQAQQQRPYSRDGVFRGQEPAASSRKMFGVSLDELFNRDKSPVPFVVIQCIQAVDMFGLETEGIYRVSGNQTQVQQLRARIDQDATPIDFRNPDNFFHDVHVPANLLKVFLRDLPEPLLTSERYNDFMNAARIDDDIVRRDSMHAIINELPDPNYATLRAIVLHLHRVDEYSHANRMTPQNLAVIFGPTLMGPHMGDMAVAGLQPKVIATILQNSLEIFDED